MITKEEIILLDCDGPCADFDSAIIKAVNANITEQTLNEFGEWDIFKLFSEMEMIEVRKILKDSSFWANLVPNEHALKAVEKMRSLGAKVVFLTAPYSDCLEWEHTRRNWIKKHFGAKDSEVIVTSAKEYVYGDIFIEDRLAFLTPWLIRWGSKKKKAIMFETPTNRNSNWYPRVVVKDGNWKILESKE